MTATPRCPSCGAPLVHPEIADHTPQVAPWLCTGERLGFWNAELTEDARRRYRPHRRDWGPNARHIREAVDKERKG